MKTKKIEDYDLSTRSGRYQARQAGFDVPKQKAGKKPQDIEDLINRDGDCWEWMGTKDSCGYGRVSLDGREHKIHRIMYEKVHGKLSEGAILMHSCDNPGCVNPDHLSPGTHQMNQADKVAKNRQAKGENNGGSKLTEAQVLEIRKLHSQYQLKQIEIANRFSVCRDTIRKIISREYWSHCA